MCTAVVNGSGSVAALLGRDLACSRQADTGPHYVPLPETETTTWPPTDEPIPSPPPPAARHLIALHPALCHLPTPQTAEELC
jgi:hypothetical protein